MNYSAGLFPLPSFYPWVSAFCKVAESEITRSTGVRAGCGETGVYAIRHLKDPLVAPGSCPPSRGETPRNRFSKKRPTLGRVATPTAQPVRAPFHILEIPIGTLGHVSFTHHSSAPHHGHLRLHNLHQQTDTQQPLPHLYSGRPVLTQEHELHASHPYESCSLCLRLSYSSLVATCVTLGICTNKTSRSPVNYTLNGRILSVK